MRVTLHSRFYSSRIVATADDFLTDHFPTEKQALRLTLRAHARERSNLPQCRTKQKPMPDSDDEKDDPRTTRRQPERSKFPVVAICHSLWRACGITQLPAVEGMPWPPRQWLTSRSVQGDCTPVDDFPVWMKTQDCGGTYYWQVDDAGD